MSNQYKWIYLWYQNNEWAFQQSDGTRINISNLLGLLYQNGSLVNVGGVNPHTGVISFSKAPSVGTFTATIVSDEE